MLKVGLTGGIGSGKSSVAAIFRVIGIPVFIADLHARSLLATHPEVREEVVALLGAESYDTGGSPDRGFIARKVFQDGVLLEGLNAIIHPAVRKEFEVWSEQYIDRSYVIQEAAVLFESGGSALMDENILVWAPEELRIRRVMDRDNITDSEVKARIQHQWNDDEKAGIAQFVIVNDSNHSLIRQVLDINSVLRHISSTS